MTRPLLMAAVGVCLAITTLASPSRAADSEGAAADLRLIAAARSDQVAAQGQTPSSPEMALATKGEAKVCLACHNKPDVTGIFHRAHAQSGDKRTPFAYQACSSCHGAPGDHIKNPIKYKPEIRFGMESPTPPARQNAVCLGCHEGGMRTHWRTSRHASADLVCAACHDAHAPRSPLGRQAGFAQRNTEAEVCFACHQDVRAQTFRRSHHPIRENEVTCSDCHNPHGSAGPSQLIEISVNETCYECHQEKRGPFLWEHQPVREDCGICHEPHGATQPGLLVTRGPWLCQSCHSAQFHPSTLYSGESVRNFDEHTLARNCLNCHPKVHGSNHPSGVRLTR